MSGNIINHGFFDPFRENRLVFREKAGEAPKKKRKTPEQIRKDTRALLERLSGDPFAQTEEKKKKPRPRTHTDTQRHTREAYEPRPYYPESVRIAERAVALSGRREAKETRLMQGVHENLYRQYMNPSFMMHLQAQPGELPKKIYPILDLIMQHPDDFDYVSKGHGVLHIVKRKPFKGRPSVIQDNFLVVMEGGAGSITRVRNGSFDKPLKLGDKIPWISNDQFNRDLPLYNKLWNTTVSNYLLAGGYREWARSDQTPEGYKKLKARMYQEVGIKEKEVVEIYVAMNILFPQRFVDLVRARNLGWELTDPRVKRILDTQPYQGKTYEDITTHGYGKNGKLRITVLADPDNPGIYLMYTQSTRYQPLRVNMLGQVMRQAKDGSWAPDARYEDNVRRRYYYRENGGKNKDLLHPDPSKKEVGDTTITAEERARMEHAETESKTGSKTDKEVADMYDLIEKRQKVDAVLYTSKDLAKLEHITLYLLTDAQKRDPKVLALIAKKMAQRDYKWFRQGIKRTLDHEDLPILRADRNAYVAGVLGVAL